MTDGPRLSRRARVARWAFVIGTTFAAIFAFPTWSTAAVIALLFASWFGGTAWGFLMDEYWPRKAHTPKEWTSRDVYRDRRRLW